MLLAIYKHCTLPSNLHVVLISDSRVFLATLQLLHGCVVACEHQWKERRDTNALGAEKSKSFAVPDVDTCKNECASVPSCVAVDINVYDDPMVCWPHLNPEDLDERNIYRQIGTNLYQLTGSCASSKQTHASNIHLICRLLERYDIRALIHAPKIINRLQKSAP